MITLSMATHKQDLVINVPTAFSIEHVDVVLKFLPLSEGLVALVVGGISTIDQSEVCRRLSHIISY